MGEVIRLDSAPANDACPKCGDEWATARVVVDRKGHITAHGLEVTCASCGATRMLPMREVPSS